MFISPWKDFWPDSGQKVLDVGAGTGRDSKWFIDRGCDVYALEPNAEMRTEGQAYVNNAIWINESLPDLKNTLTIGLRFDLILLSAVWMHVAPSYRERAFRKLSNLLAPNGKLVITLRPRWIRRWSR